MLLPLGPFIAGIVIYHKNPTGSPVRQTYWWVFAAMIFFAFANNT